MILIKNGYKFLLIVLKPVTVACYKITKKTVLAIKDMF